MKLSECEKFPWPAVGGRAFGRLQWFLHGDKPLMSPTEALCAD